MTTTTSTMPIGPAGIPVFPGGDVTIYNQWPVIFRAEDYFVIIGCVTYHDQFVESAKTPIRHTEFCFRSIAPMNDYLSGKATWDQLYQCLVATQVD